MTRIRKEKAREILMRHVAAAGLQVVSAFQVEKTPRLEAADLAWWHAHTPTNETSDTVRNLAYLRAYLEIAERDQLTAKGLQIEGARLYMDRSVVSRLERDEFLHFVEKRDGFFEPFFELTDKGREWVKL